MKLFVDSANLSDIEAALVRGFVSGVTTNPSILGGRRDYREHIRDIITLLGKWGRSVPSVEVFTTDPDEMVVQAAEFVREFGDCDGLAIKVPIGWDELRVANALTERGIKVNATCCMSFNRRSWPSMREHTS
jgi:transaldolase